jgi:hypothetical protein
MDRQPDAMLEHRIQQRAYEIHQKKANGSPLEDWLEAERQVLREVRYSHDRFSYAPKPESKQPREAICGNES